MENKKTLENLKYQLKKVIKEHPIDVNEDTYWRGVKIGLETAIEVIKLEQEQYNNKYSDEEVESICIEMVNWTIDNIGNSNAKSGEKFKKLIEKFKKK
jgi:hypothetical protein